MIILGLDPGSLTTGWAIIEKKNQLSTIKSWGIIKGKESKKQENSLKNTTLSERLAVIYTQLSQVITQNAPSIMVIEKIFVSKNPLSALALGHARGVALLTAALNEINVIEYSPNSVKKSLTGHGHASKEQMIAMIFRLFHVTLPHDAADAAALALCHSYQNPLWV